MRLGLLLTLRNGASGYWSVAASDSVGPTFVIECDPDIASDEAVLAHEVAHPIVRLMGVPTGISLGQIDARVGDEFTSTSHHPFVFSLLDEAGYGAEQTEQYRASAEQELRKLSAAEFASPTYQQPPGQIWLALWYFNFFILAREQYDAIRLLHLERASGVAAMMDVVTSSWLDATRGTGILKRSAGTTPIKAFQSHLHAKLSLTGRVGLKSREQWIHWLFQNR
jgi:hypothetical protein